MPSIVDKSSVKMICVDDFALRKRFSYGTVMINLENHRIIDMIPSRDTNDVCNWLKTFHNIEVISRDGAITYASAATNSHPDVIQISDRFHLIKGLSEVICKYIFREFPARVEIPLTESIKHGKNLMSLYNTILFFVQRIQMFIIIVIFIHFLMPDKHILSYSLNLLASLILSCTILVNSASYIVLFIVSSSLFLFYEIIISLTIFLSTKISPRTCCYKSTWTYSDV